MKSPEQRIKAQRKVDYENYDAITMSRNYYRNLSASIYHHAKNMGIIGILAYPKIFIRALPLFRFIVVFKDTIQAF